MRQLSLIALILLSTFTPCSITAQTTTNQTPVNIPVQSVPLNPINTQQMIEFFSKLKTPDFPAWLYSTTRSAPDLQSSDKHFARATWLAQLHIVQDQETCDQLHQQAVPVLKLFHRLHTIRFFIYLDDYPNIQTIAGSYLGVSTGLIRLLKRDSRDNSQLNALVAHELARTIHQDRFVEAWTHEDFQTVKAFELFYDAVATSALNHLQLQSEQYGLILDRMTRNTTGRDTDHTRHPTLEQRQSLIRTIGLPQRSSLIALN